MTASSRDFIDTNIVIYAFTADARSEKALALLGKGCVISVQVLNEFANVAVRKLGMNWIEVDDALDSIRTLCPIIQPLDMDTHLRAMELAKRYNASIFDSLVIASALQSGCDTLWSEDMQHGLVVESHLRIANPFRA
ncbi:MAG: PIN domain-containing protein [Pseudomonadota bacterium]